MANTSLAQQLRRLATPQTSILLADKKRASILFDPKEAANLDLSTVLEIGVSGLRELQDIGGPEFNSFEKDLFDATSVGVERAVLNEEANSVLDERIHRFLVLISPYALLKPTHRALEWLVRRFHIHEYNQDALIFLFLPYHESKIFVRVLQLIDVSSSSNHWHWLQPLRHAGTSLPHSTIVGHASSSNAFLAGLCEHILLSVKVYKGKANILSTLFAFYCTTIVGAIEHIKKRRKGTILSAREAQLQVILPCLMNGLSSDFPDFACASFMVVSSLTRNGFLSETLLHKTINKIAKNCGSETFQLREVTVLLAIICELQSSTSEDIFPSRALKKMLKNEILIPMIRHISSISGVAYVGNLSMALFVGLLPFAREAVGIELAPVSRSTLDELISSVALDKKFSEKAIRLLVCTLADVMELEKCDADFSDQLYLSWLNGVLQNMEKKYPQSYDVVVRELVSVKGNEKEKMASVFGRLLGMTVLNKEDFGALVERLCHPEEGVRVVALEKLARMDVAALKSPEDSQTLLWIIEQRLQDDSANVIKGALALPFLDSLLGSSRLINQVMHIVERTSQNMHRTTDKERWLGVVLSALRLLFSCGLKRTESNEGVKDLLDRRVKVLLTVFPFLCPTSEEEVGITQEVLKMPCTEPLLDGLWKDLSESEDHKGYCCAAFSHLMKFESLVTEDRVEVMDLVETLGTHIRQNRSNIVAHLIAITVLSGIARKSSITVKSRILEFTIKSLNHSKVSIARGSDRKPIKNEISAESLATCIFTAKKGCLPLQAILHSFSSVFHSSTSSWFTKMDTAWWIHSGLQKGAKDEEFQFMKLAVHVFDVLVFGCFLRKSGKSLPKDVADAQMLYVMCLKDFFDAQLPDLSCQLNFLSCLWVAHECPVYADEAQRELTSIDGKLTIHSKEKDHFYNYSLSRWGYSILPELQIRSLRLAEALISGSKSAVSWTLAPDGAGVAIIPSILITCTSPVNCVRAATIPLLQALMSTVGASLALQQNSYTPFVKELLEQSEEILLDPGQLPLIMYTLLSPEPDIAAIHPAHVVREMSKIKDTLFSLLRPDSPAPCHIKRALLQILYGIRSVEILKDLSQLGMHLLEESQRKSAMDEYFTDCFVAIIGRYDRTVAPSIADSEKDSSLLWTFFKKSLSDTVTELVVTEDVKHLMFSKSDYLNAVCPAMLSMHQVTKDFYDALTSQNVRSEILSLMIDVASQSNIKTSSRTLKEFPLSEAASLAAKSAIKRLTIDANLIVEELKKMLDCDEDPGNRRSSLRKPTKKVISVLTTKMLQSQSWMRGVVLLEIMQIKKKIKNPQLILPLLFELLKMCLQLKHQEPVEYTKQLILACALHSLRKVDDNEVDEDDELEHKKIDKSQLDVETIVDCIRSTQNPHTHRHALLLLSRAAELLPDSVLHNVMAIFAFVGTSLVRQDDEYSFEVISRTIESIVPILTKEKSITRKKAYEGFQEILGGPGAAGILKVTRVFADAVPDVPPHRRLPLYVKLVETVGWDIGLPQLLLLVIEGHVLHGRAKPHDQGGGRSNFDSRMELAQEIAREAPPCALILTILRMVEFICMLPADKESGANGKILWHSRQTEESKLITHNFTHIFDVKTHTGLQLRHFKHAVLSFLLDVVSEPQIVAKVSLVKEVDTEDVKKNEGVDKLFQNLIQALLSYIATVAGELDGSGGSSSGRYWKAMQQRCHQVLEKVNGLLPGSLFLDVVRGLLEYQLLSVRRKAADILNNRLLALLNEKRTPTDACASFSKEDRNSLRGIMLGPLITMVHNREVGQTDSTVTKEIDLNCQVALFTIKLLIRILGPVEKPEVLKEVLSHVTRVTSAALAVKGELSPTSPGIVASAVLCVAEVCSVLKVNALTELHQFMPVVISALCSNMKDGANTSAQIGVVTAVQRIVESIPNFISPYLKNLLVRLCLFASQQTADGDGKYSLQNKNDQLSLRLASILNKVASAIPLRVLIPAVGDTYTVLTEGKFEPSSHIPSRESKKHKRLRSSSKEEVVTSGEFVEQLPNKSECHTAIIPLMEMYSHSLSEMTREDLNNHLQDLETFFLGALDFRARHKDMDNSDLVENVESSTVGALVVLVLKLSETMFRPLYYRLFEWASGEKVFPHRAITFYRLSSRCADALKGLFVLFAGHFIRHAAALLDRNNLAKIGANENKGAKVSEGSSTEGNEATPEENSLFFGEEDLDGTKAHLLITSILSTLHAVFLHDGTGRFVTSARFETLMPPLVNQLENLMGGTELFQERCTSNVIPTLVKFAVAAADDSLWKQLNYQILLKTRHSNPKVRLAGLSTLLELGKQLGEDFLPLLPETVPFLAELMEDEEEEVEVAAQKAIAILSDVLGEQLQKYF